MLGNAVRGFSLLDTLETDVVVLGAGLAGVVAALAVREAGRRVIVVSESRGPSASERSGGNFRAPVSGYSPEQHFLDTVAGGDYLAQRSLAKALAQDASRTETFLTGLGVRVKEGETGFRVLADNACPGRVLMNKLEELLKTSGVPVVRALGWEVLLDSSGSACGVLAYDATKADWLVVGAPAVVLATGGAAGAYLRTDNSTEATGDGIAMAFRAGAALADMEFVQFWPLTALGEGVCSDLPWTSLAGKGLLADGARDITDKVGLRKLASGQGSPAEVARLIYREAMPEAPGSAQERSLTLAPSGGGEAIPVTPAAHHTMGGVVCGDHGQTRVAGLFAAGEVAAGVHGANRITGNGLTEAIVMGRRAGALAATAAAGRPAEPASATPVERFAREQVRRTSALLEGSESEGLRPADAAQRIREVMWLQAGPIRSRESLDAVQSTLNKIKRAIPLTVDLANGEDVRSGLKALNLLAVAEAITRSARYRRESRGVHFRADYPDKDDAEWLCHVRVKLLHGEMSLDISQGLELMEP